LHTFTGVFPKMSALVADLRNSMRQASITIKEHVVNQYSAPSRAQNVKDVIKYAHRKT
jgi:hypothetical protein